MKPAEFEQVVTALVRLETAIMERKGKDYQRDKEDILSNFKKVGEDVLPILRSVFDRSANEVELVGLPKEMREALAKIEYEFKVQYNEAKLQKIATLLAWYVYFRKHVDAIISYVVTGKLESEGLLSRIIDVRNYLALLTGIAVEYEDVDLNKGAENESLDTSGG